MDDDRPYPEAFHGLEPFLDAPETESRRAATREGAYLDAQASLAETFRHSGWRAERRRVLEALVRTEQPQARQQEFRRCGSHAYVLQNVSDPDDYRVAGSACHDRFCQPCGQERSQTIALNVLEHITDKQVRFVTLTVKSEAEPLADLLDKLYVAFRALRARAFWKKRVRGGVAFLEIKWSPGRQRWHPHFHILVEGHYMPHKDLKRIWHEITGDSFVVDIRLVRAAQEAARYVTKYAAKPLNKTYVNDADRLDEAILALKGRKLAVTFGSWRGVTLARTIEEGAWINVGSLEEHIVNAAHGSKTAIAVMQCLTNKDLTSLYERAPPRYVPLAPRAKPDEQAEWFGTWQADGTYKYPCD